jgi:two-component system sensor kinase FixL
MDAIVIDVLADAERASQTLSSLRTLFHKGEASHTPVDVSAAVADVLRLLEGEMRQRRIRVQFVREAMSPQILGDAVQLRQGLINLLINAAEAISACGDTLREIQIESREASAGRVEILVRDSGVGVAECDLERIFEHFVSSKPQGLGMGLAITRSIVQSHGGLIWATRNEGRGLTIHVDFPSEAVASQVREG